MKNFVQREKGRIEQKKKEILNKKWHTNGYMLYSYNYYNMIFNFWEACVFDKKHMTVRNTMSRFNQLTAKNMP